MKKFQNLLGALTANIAPLAPVLLAAAAAAVWFASSSLLSTMERINVAQTAETQSLTLETLPIDNKRALEAAKKLAKLAPATTVAVSTRYVVVSIAKPELFAEWMHALSEVQTLAKDVQWEIEDMCVASCEGGEAAKAYLTAYKHKLKAVSLSGAAAGS